MIVIRKKISRQLSDFDVQLSEEEKAKQERRKERNRVAAKNSRNKRKKHQQQVEHVCLLSVSLSLVYVCEKQVTMLLSNYL